MSNDLTYFHNVSTGEITIEEMDAEQQTERNAQIAVWNAEQKAKQDMAEALRQTKISAYEKLGLTEAEIEALLPSPKPPVE